MSQLAMKGGQTWPSPATLKPQVRSEFARSAFLCLIS